MLTYWREWARDFGFDGIHVVQELNGFEKDILQGFDALIEFEPMFTIRNDFPLSRKFVRYSKAAINRVILKAGIKTSEFLDILDYDYVWKRILERRRNNRDIVTYLGAFVDWDNTSRRGKKGTIIKGATPEKFHRYLAAILNLKRAGQFGDLIFVNAWNEWAEGAYLEPDQKYELSYLRSVKRATDEFRSEGTGGK
jgi:hypothetical protein